MIAIPIVLFVFFLTNASSILIEKDRQNEIFSIDIDQFDPITTKNTTSKSALQAYGNAIIEKIRRGYLVLFGERIGEQAVLCNCTEKCDKRLVKLLGTAFENITVSQTGYCWMQRTYHPEFETFEPILKFGSLDTSPWKDSFACRSFSGTRSICCDTHFCTSLYEIPPDWSIIFTGVYRHVFRNFIFFLFPFTAVLLITLLTLWFRFRKGKGNNKRVVSRKISPVWLHSRLQRWLPGRSFKEERQKFSEEEHFDLKQFLDRTEDLYGYL